MNKEYSVIFNLNKQNNMRNFFLNDLVQYGKTTSHEKQNILYNHINYFAFDFKYINKNIYEYILKNINNYF